MGRWSRNEDDEEDDDEEGVKEDKEDRKGTTDLLARIHKTIMSET